MRGYTHCIFHNIQNLYFERFEENNKKRNAHYSDGNVCALWKAVITQALIDAASNSKKRIDRLNKIRSIEWLREGGEDFVEVCNMANLDPQYVQRKALEAMNRGCKWRNDDRKIAPIDIDVKKLKSDYSAQLTRKSYSLMKD